MRICFHVEKIHIHLRPTSRFAQLFVVGKVGVLRDARDIALAQHSGECVQLPTAHQEGFVLMRIVAAETRPKASKRL